jgi:hypothetical protein
MSGFSSGGRCSFPTVPQPVRTAATTLKPSIGWWRSMRLRSRCEGRVDLSITTRPARLTLGGIFCHRNCHRMTKHQIKLEGIRKRRGALVIQSKWAQLNLVGSVVTAQVELANRRLQPLGHISGKADMPDAGASRKRQISDQPFNDCGSPAAVPKRVSEAGTACRGLDLSGPPQMWQIRLAIFRMHHLWHAGCRAARVSHSQVIAQDNFRQCRRTDSIQECAGVG